MAARLLHPVGAVPLDDDALLWLGLLGVVDVRTGPTAYCRATVGHSRLHHKFQSYCREYSGQIMCIY